MDRVIASLPADTLASMGSEAKIVLSNEPTQMEYALPEEGIQAVNQLLADQQIWRSQAKQILPKRTGQKPYNEQSLANLSTAKRIVISISRITHQFGFQANIRLADDQGRILAEDFRQILSLIHI